MGRNFAALFFLAYGFFLTLLSRKLLLKKMVKRAPAAVRRHTSGAVNYFFLKKLKKGIPSPIYRLHYWNTACLFGLMGLHLIFGWLAVFKVLFIILDTIALLLVALESSLLSARENVRLFGRAFVLYAADPDPASRRAFVSSLIDGIFYILIPLAMAICNFVI